MKSINQCNRRSLIRDSLFGSLALASFHKVFGFTQDTESIVSYVALDREFSEPILKRYETETGKAIRAKYDVESTKTIGLVNLIRTEAQRPRADLFWNNEIINTIRLKRLGLLASHVPVQAADFPSLFRDPENQWHGFAARARILLINRKAIRKGPAPTSIFDLAAPQWRGQTAIAKPFFGTTATHAACLYASQGTRVADQFFASLKKNDVQILSGNKPVAEAVASGQAAFGLTDTDDALVVQSQGHDVEIVYPDQTKNGMGTLFIPNTLALIQNGPNPTAASKLLDWLYRPEIETLLSNGPSGQIPVSSKSKSSRQVKGPTESVAMNGEFEKAADLFDEVMKRLASLFQS